MENKLVEEVIEKLKKENIRITPQRYAVLEYLIEHHSHPTADEIYKALEHRFPKHECCDRLQQSSSCLLRLDLFKK